jgi:hypothetical protein
VQEGRTHKTDSADERNSKGSWTRASAAGVPFVVGERRESVVNFDWTEVEDADQGTVVLGMPTEPGHSTPLVWKTVTRSALKDQRHDHADDCLVVLASVVPKHVRVPVVADRCFSDRTLSWSESRTRP